MFCWRKYPLCPSLMYACARPASPPVGRSTLITSAPMPGEAARQVGPREEVCVVDDADAGERQRGGGHEDSGSTLGRRPVGAAFGRGDHELVLAVLDDLAVLVHELRGQHDDAPAGFALRCPHARDLEGHVQRVADADRREEVPGPAERIAGEEAVIGLALQAVGDRQAHQPVRNAPAEVRLLRVLLVHVQRRAVAGEIGVGVDHCAGDGHRGGLRSCTLVADLRVVPRGTGARARHARPAPSVRASRAGDVDVTASRILFLAGARSW